MNILQHKSNTASNTGTTHARSKVMVQPKLTINAPGDVYEQEADAMAERVMRMPLNGTLATPRTGLTGSSVRQVCSTSLVSSINDTKGGGSPLSQGTKTIMENAFSTDFSEVRIHSDDKASEMSQQIHAKAFTHGSDIYFRSGQFDPESSGGKKLLAHELTHVVQQKPRGSADTGLSNMPMVQREPDSTDEDPQAALSPEQMKHWQSLYDLIGGMLGGGLLYIIASSEIASPSVTRKRFLNELGGPLSAQLGAVSNEVQLKNFEVAFDDWRKRFYDTTEKAGEEWLGVKDQYEEELLRLTDSGSLVNFYSLDYLRGIYSGTIKRMVKVSTDCIVPDDYAELKNVLEKDRHILKGELKASRQRAGELKDMLGVVGDLRQTGQDADKLLPDWDDRLTQEQSRLAGLAEWTEDANDKAYFVALSAELDTHRASALAKHLPEKTAVEKGLALAKGAVSAVTDPLVEAGKQTVDLAQIAVHFTSLTYYKPKFISDVGKAAEAGQSTTDLLVGMAKGLVETPGRLWDAIEKGDWEAIGRESVNLYLLAKSGKEGYAKAKPYMRMLRARFSGLKLIDGGISASAALEAAAIAKREKLVIRIRPTEKVVVKLREAGHPAKPEFLKMKTIKEVDLELGAGKADLGKVGYFKPKLPKGFEKLSEARKAEVQARFNERTTEWSRYSEKVDKLTSEGKIEVKGKVVVDPKTGKAFTGDYDLFDIRRGGITGEGVEFESLSPATQASLKASPVEVQHGAHLDWKEIPAGMADGYADIILNARPKPGSKALIEFHPDGKIRYGFFTD